MPMPLPPLRVNLPSQRACVRCGHTAGSHRADAGCQERLSLLHVWRRCPCERYVPPGASPGKTDQEAELRSTP